MNLKGNNNDFKERAKATWCKNKLKIYNCIIRPATLYTIKSMRPLIMLINKFVSLEKKVLYCFFKKETYPTKCIKDIILDRMEKAKKPFDVYVEKEWKRPVERLLKRLISLIHDNS
uniref:Uncharacterized protein n=1 Tax=Strongyloides venezuelensis TaxID=75913 RepID=A0A0K0FGG8_STRVS